MVADLISTAGADRILTMDLHASQIQGFFDIPVDHLFAAPVVLEAIRRLELPKLTIVSPDAGGVERARAIAKRLDADLAIVDKRRTAPNTAEVMNLIGEVEGRTAFVIDDIIDTAGTLTKTAKALADRGAERIFRCRGTWSALRTGHRSGQWMPYRCYLRYQHNSLGGKDRNNVRS